MDLLKKLKRIEDRIESFFESDSNAKSGETSQKESVSQRRLEPLELKKAILERIEENIRRIDGKLSFPFNRVDVDVITDTPQFRALVEAELVDEGRLERDISRTLSRARVPLDQPLLVRVHFTDPDPKHGPELRREGFMVHCSREQVTEKVPTRKPNQATLTVRSGSAEPSPLLLGAGRTNLGRLREVLDDRGRVVRRNDLVFSDDSGINATVSRMHAHIQREEDGSFRIFDDQSAEGVVVFRQGRRLDVPPSQRRGLMLQDGDEIYLGQACLYFKLG